MKQTWHRRLHLGQKALRLKTTCQNFRLGDTTIFHTLFRRPQSGLGGISFEGTLSKRKTCTDELGSSGSGVYHVIPALPQDCSSVHLQNFPTEKTSLVLVILSIFSSHFCLFGENTSRIFWHWRLNYVGQEAVWCKQISTRQPSMLGLPQSECERPPYHIIRSRLSVTEPISSH